MRCKKGLGLLLALLLLLLPVMPAFADSQPEIRNIILLIGDGMGPNHLTLAREHGVDLFMDKNANAYGFSRTRSADHEVTDSAAGGTALACGVRTLNRAIGTYQNDPAGLIALPVSIAEVAKARGMRTGVCLLPGPNAAYAAAVSDAEARGLVPRALVLPIWPGDSSYSSIYEYHAMRAGLRMLNGYAAVTEPAYVERVFRRFETMTEGDFTDDQYAALRKTGVTHVILHEDAFPSKVSLFPFGATLRRHLANPRIRLLSHSSGAWTFAVVDNPSSHSSLVTRHSNRPPATGT